MSNNDSNIVLSDSAAAIVKADVSAFKRDRKRYSDYVAEMEVLTEDVAAHVALFRDAYKAAYPKADGDEVKAYATKVRNGLNYWTGKRATDDDDKAPALVTAAGGKATLAEVTAAWEALQS